jgi:hypothetical protein
MDQAFETVNLVIFFELIEEIKRILNLEPVSSKFKVQGSANPNLEPVSSKFKVQSLVNPNLEPETLNLPVQSSRFKVP